jgi:putative ABC transport system permease protein
MIFLPAVADGFFTIKLKSGNMAEKINQIHQLYQKYFPTEPFTYMFLDEVYDKQYRAERQLGNIFVAAAGTAVLIACLGLLGLAMFASRQRIKEIGIRKVLGASVLDLVNLISVDFLKLVVIALFIAAPIAVVIMHQWLQGFAYRTNIPWWLIALGGIIALGVAFVTVGIQAFSSATANPVKSLRSE